MPPEGILGYVWKEPFERMRHSLYQEIGLTFQLYINFNGKWYPVTYERSVNSRDSCLPVIPGRWFFYLPCIRLEITDLVLWNIFLLELLLTSKIVFYFRNKIIRSIYKNISDFSTLFFLILFSFSLIFPFLKKMCHCAMTPQTYYYHQNLIHIYTHTFTSHTLYHDSQEKCRSPRLPVTGVPYPFGRWVISSL